MLINYIIVALRNLTRQKVYAFINILGLSMSLAVSILLIGFIKYEYSYEDFHAKKDRIYRLVAEVDIGRENRLTAPMAYGVCKDWIMEEIPEVEDVLRLDYLGHPVHREDKTYRGYQGFITDQSFFDFFSIKVHKGTLNNSLAEPNQMVLSKRLASAIFGEANPIGEVVEYQGDPFVVTAVLNEWPENTHLHGDFFIPVSSLSNEMAYFQERGISVYTYFMIKEGNNYEEIADKVAAFVAKRTNDMLSQHGLTTRHFPQALEDIHLYSSTFQYNLGNPGNINSLYVLTALVFFLILIASINYMNMETARAGIRAKEIALRKVSGAGKKQLITQFLGESIVLVFISFLLALFIVELTLPMAENLFNRPFASNVFTPQNMLIYVGLAVIVGLLSGFYPAFFLSHLKPTGLFEENNAMGRKKSPLRIGLVILQFTIATLLIIDLLVVYKQLNYAKNKNLGFDSEQVLVLRNVTVRMKGKYDYLKNQFLQNPAIKSVAASSGYPGNISYHQPLQRADRQGEGFVLVKQNNVSDEYANTLGLKLIEGSYFSQEMTNDSSRYIINKKAAEMLELEPPYTGKRLIFNDREGRIIGVLQNYHLENIRKEIAPLIQTQYEGWTNNFVLRLQKDKIDQALQYIKQECAKVDAEYPFNYTFLDEYFSRMYEEEARIHQLSLIGSILAIVIAVMGLYALTSFNVLRKRREIGIRKAIGGSVKGIVRMLIWETNRWVLLSGLFSVPLAYLFAKRWLQNFAYHIELSWVFFLVGILLTLAISVLVVSYQAYKAANENPSETLRDE